METAFYVGKRRSVSELSSWRRFAIRWAYRKTGWASDYSVEAVGIFTDRNEALKAASIPGGFIHELPVNASLPDVPCKFKEHAFPLSEDYSNRDCEILAVRRCDFEKLGAAVEGVFHAAKT